MLKMFQLSMPLLAWKLRFNFETDLAEHNTLTLFISYF